MTTKPVKVWNKVLNIVGDDNYWREIGEEFEPDNVAVFAQLCDNDSQVLDVGANIGMTAIAFSQLCPYGKIAAIEPVPHVFEYLQRNIARSGSRNVTPFNFALGSCEELAVIQGHPSNCACSFIADKYQIPASDHFAYEVKAKKLDQAFAELSLDRLDLMKVDVEGFELEVLAGAKETLNAYKPIVFLEMNHWCLNLYRRISIPEYRERVMQIFPFVYAIEGLEYLDYTDPKNVHRINYHHVLEFRFMNLVAGFDREQLLSRLSLLSSLHSRAEEQPVPGLQLRRYQ